MKNSRVGVRRIEWVAFVVAAIGLTGCAPMTVNGYQSGKIKSSEVKYNYTAKPILTDPASNTYRLSTDPALSGITSVPALEKRGVHRTENGGDVFITVKAAGPMRHEAAGFGMAAPYKPAQMSSMPIQITVKDKAGRVLSEQSFVHEEALVLDSGAGFKTREEAKAAMSSISDVMKSKAEEKVKQAAPRTVNKNLEQIAKGLVEQRKISVTIPGIRTAGTVDMEEAYTLLKSAKGDEQAKQALSAYTALGTQHKKPDGSDDVVGNYGVVCGAASAKILSGDLTGSWADTKTAWKMFPEGKEHRAIAKVLYTQQQDAGVEIIPKAELDEMVKQDVNQSVDQLKSLFKKKE